MNGSGFEEGGDWGSIRVYDNFHQLLDLGRDKRPEDSALVSEMVVETAARYAAGQANVFHFGSVKPTFENYPSGLKQDGLASVRFCESCAHAYLFTDMCR